MVSTQATPQLLSSEVKDFLPAYLKFIGADREQDAGFIESLSRGRRLQQEATCICLYTACENLPFVLYFKCLNRRL